MRVKASRRVLMMGKVRRRSGTQARKARMMTKARGRARRAI